MFVADTSNDLASGLIYYVLLCMPNSDIAVFSKLFTNVHKTNIYQINSSTA